MLIEGLTAVLDFTEGFDTIICVAVNRCMTNNCFHSNKDRSQF